MPFGGKSLPEQVQLLDRLQKEVNVVLEQTGRLLATNAVNKAALSAQGTKLKAILPGAEDRFNDALNSLSEEIHFAKIVMRRDLAVAREQAGIPKPTAITTTAVQNRPSSKRASPDESGVEDAPEAKRVKLSPEKAAPLKENSVLDINGRRGTGSAKSSETSTGGPSGEAPNSNAAPSTPPSAPEDTRDEPAAPSKPTHSTADETNNQQLESTDPSHTTTQTTAQTTDKQPHEPNLSLDTTTQQQSSTTTAPDTSQQYSSKAPDTAITNNADLDSLFGGPTTSIPTANTADMNDDTDPFDAANLDVVDVGSGGDFDFGLPTTESQNELLDNDNISALLPGLQDYANEGGQGVDTGTGDADFDAIFGEAAMGEGGDGEQTGVDGLLEDFDFEAEFGLDGGANAKQGDNAGGGDGIGDDIFNFE